MNDTSPATRHVLALSGGKDSSALAIYLHKKIPNLEYVFCDTGEELEETYEYLHKLQGFLTKKIVILKSEKDFKYYLDMYNGVLPDPQTRWCTRMLKLRPYESFIGKDTVISYVGIRADEPQRTGYISTKPNIKTVFPFIENNIRYDDVMRFLEESGLGLPAYYNWRSRSGCYFCFFQQKREWIGLLKHHPHLYQKAKEFEKFDEVNNTKFTWNKKESLAELAQPTRITQIMLDFEKRQQREEKRFQSHQKLSSIWSGDSPVDCNICQL